ncbi:hypothetical protein SGRIM119S_03108 [Streptomyces griseorubiginosus]
MREHRQDRAADGETEAVQGGRTLAEQGLGDRLEGAGQHHGTADVGRWCLRRPGESLDGDRAQRALPYLPADQPEQEPLLVLGGRAQQLTDQPRPFGLRARARDLAERGETVVHLADGQARLGGGCDRAAQHLPPDAEPALREPSREVRDDDGHVVRLRLPEQLREQRDLLGARRGRGDLPGHLCQSGKQHSSRVYRRSRVYTPAAVSRSAISRSPLIAAPAR